MEKLNLLVVDDEIGMRLAIERTLANFSFHFPYVSEPVGFNIQMTPTGEDALQVIETNPPDILLLDHKLPGMSGMDILRILIEQEHPVLTLMITAYASIETAIKAVKLGAYDFLAKPFTPDELKTSVQRAARHFMLERQAHQADEEKRKLRFELISMVAHELKSPLTAVDSYLSIVRNRNLGKDIDQYNPIIERCLARTQGMAKLIGDLLDMTMLESGHIERKIVTCDLWKIIEPVIETSRILAEEKEIYIDFRGKRPLEIAADRWEISIILNNLISNAIKYNHKGGEIKVKFERIPQYLIIEVTDDGIGMSPSESARIFNDFVRIKNTKTENILGSGLGLSIVKKITALYNGKIEVQSAPDQGSTFTVTLNMA